MWFDSTSSHVMKRYKIEWTDSMDDAIRAGLDAKTLEELGAEIGVSDSSVRSRIYALGLGERYENGERRAKLRLRDDYGWEEWQDKLLREHWHDMKLDELAAITGKSVPAVVAHGYKRMGPKRGSKDAVGVRRKPSRRKACVKVTVCKPDLAGRECVKCANYPCFVGQLGPRFVGRNYAAEGCVKYHTEKR